MLLPGPVRPAQEARPARCYHEFCCYPAVANVTDYGDGASGPFDPAKPVYEYRGRWGFCPLHAEGGR